MRKLPIGIQSFEDIRKDGYVYVDKTEYIWNLVSTGKVYFLSRPRRFGKSLLISTLQAYFEGKKDLFEGLSIAAHEAAKPAEEQWISYPVLRFSLSGGQYDAPGGLEDNLSRILVETARKYDVDESAILGNTIPVRFQSLIGLLKQKTGRSVVVLVDEYDKALLVNLSTNREILEQNRGLFKGMFSGLKDMDDDLKFVFFSGVTKFGKVSIFSDLNQLRDISLEDPYSAICGITDEELNNNFQDNIEALSAAQKLTYEETLARLARTYDGYHFSSNSEGVYNPYSLLNALASGKFGSYWFETGTPTFLIRKLEESGAFVQDFSGGVRATESRLSNSRADDFDLLPLYYQSGYLTIKDFDPEFKEYVLSYPNDEVKYGYLEALIPVAQAGYDTPDTVFSASRMVRALKDGNAESVLRMLQALLAGIPYYEGQAPQNEQQWRNLLYAIFSVLGQYVRAEVHSARGRSDCIVENEDYVYIFEFKQDKSAGEALRQIDEKGYVFPNAASGKHIVKIGANFSSEKKTLDEWKIETDMD